jgi:hypothetical protein
VILKKVNQNKKNRKIIQNFIIFLIKKNYPQYFKEKKNYVKKFISNKRNSSFVIKLNLSFTTILLFYKKYILSIFYAS